MDPVGGFRGWRTGGNTRGSTEKSPSHLGKPESVLVRTNVAHVYDVVDAQQKSVFRKYIMTTKGSQAQKGKVHYITISLWYSDFFYYCSLKSVEDSIKSLSKMEVD